MTRGLKNVLLNALEALYKTVSCLGGGTGRRKGLKIPRLLVGVRVQFPPQAPLKSRG